MHAEKAKFTCDREKKKALYAAALAEFDANTLLKDEISRLKGSLEAERLKVYKRCSRDATDAADAPDEATGYKYHWKGGACDPSRATNTAWGKKWSKDKCDAKTATADAAADDVKIGTAACAGTTASPCTAAVTVTTANPQLKLVMLTAQSTNAPNLTAITGTATDISALAAVTSTG